MRNVIYSMGVSLDGFVAGPGGDIDWSAPDEDLLRFHNEQTADLGTHLCGRRLYEAMVYWETAELQTTLSDDELQFARIWRALPKIVFSSTLQTVQGNARLARRSVAEEVAELTGQPVAVNILLPGGATNTGMIPDGAPAEIRTGLLDPAIMGPPIVWLASEQAAGVHDQRIVATEFEHWLAAR
jgi:RibD C-terminal domain